MTAVAAFLALAMAARAAAPPPAAPAGRTVTGSRIAPAAPRALVVTYFVMNVRCPTCLAIEARSREAVLEGFPREVASGRVAFRVLNLDLPENAHYADDYRLVTKSVIVAEFVREREARWKNLGDVWRLAHGPKAAFLAYVRGEVRAWLKPK